MLLSGWNAVPESIQSDVEQVRAHSVLYVLSIVLAALTNTPTNPRLPKIAAACFLTGIVFFSASLYLLAITEARWLGMITPLGGVAFLAGWLSLAASALKPIPQHTAHS